MGSYLISCCLWRTRLWSHVELNEPLGNSFRVCSLLSSNFFPCSSFCLCYSCYEDYDSSALSHAPYHDDIIFLTTAQETVESSVHRLKPRKSSANIKLPSCQLTFSDICHGDRKELRCDLLHKIAPCIFSYPSLSRSYTEELNPTFSKISASVET